MVAVRDFFVGSLRYVAKSAHYDVQLLRVHVILLQPYRPIGLAGLLLVRTFAHLRNG